MVERQHGLASASSPSSSVLGKSMLRESEARMLYPDQKRTRSTPRAAASNNTSSQRNGTSAAGSRPSFRRKGAWRPDTLSATSRPASTRRSKLIVIRLMVSNCVIFGMPEENARTQTDASIFTSAIDVFMWQAHLWTPVSTQHPNAQVFRD